jgi:hypothetical protein
VVLSAKVEVAPPEFGMTRAGLNEHEAPAGKPAEHVSVTPELKPEAVRSVTVEVVVWPTMTAAENGDAVIEKVGPFMTCVRTGETLPLKF